MEDKKDIVIADNFFVSITIMQELAKNGNEEAEKKVAWLTTKSQHP